MSSEENQTENPIYWTDDLPVCDLSGVGFLTNQMYRPDGLRREEHEFEDRSFHFKLENGIYLYGLFDGHNGSRVSSTAAQHIAAELLLGQLNDKHTDDDIMQLLRQAFVSVEKEVSKLIDDTLAEKHSLQATLPQGLTRAEQSQQYPDITKRLRSIETQLHAGTTALVALIVDNRLFVANIGCSRALLCTMDARGMLMIGQLSADHNLNNQSELLRLASLGLDPVRVRSLGKIGDHEYTRTIGDLHVKRGYKDMEELRDATSEPLIALPEIVGGIPLDSSVCFFALLSAGLYRTLIDCGVADSDHVNSEIASMIAQQFLTQSTLSGVAQAVVDQVARRHHDTYMTGTDGRKVLCQKRDDITLIVRNISVPLSGATSAPMHVTFTHSFPLGGMVSPSPGSYPLPGTSSHAGAPVYGGSRSQNVVTPLSVAIPSGASNRASDSSPDNRPFFQNSTFSSTASTTLDDTTSINRPFSTRHASGGKGGGDVLQLDGEGKIAAYVDFEEFHSALAAMGKEEREALERELDPRGGYETIKEEKEGSCSTPSSVMLSAVS